MDEAQELKDIKKVLSELVNAATPFLSGDVVDETMGIIPLVEKLDVCIKQAEIKLVVV